MEMVTIAAIKFFVPAVPGAIIMTGTRHANIYESIHRLKLDACGVVEGFMTSKDRFVNRVTAKQIAVAANQLIVPLEDTYTELYSEDIY